MAHDEVWYRRLKNNTEERFGFGVDDDERVCLDVTDIEWLLERAGFRFEQYR